MQKWISSRLGKIMRRTALTLSLGIFPLGQCALAKDDCKEAKGNLSEIFLPQVNSNSGTLSNAGWLNGVTLAVFGPGPVLFPLPAIAVWTGQLTITTSQGQLKASTVTLANFDTLKGSVLAKIDPAASTGIFEGATGTLFVNTTEVNITTNPQTFQSEVHGQVCFAKQ
jgi:hypothetical protein